MRKELFALLIIAVLLPAGWAETASAWHVDPDLSPTEELPDPPELPDEPPAETGILPVDRELRQVSREIGDTGRFVNETYQIFASRYSDTHRNVTGAVQQPLTVYRDGTGGFEAPDSDDRRFGGFGDWRVLGTEAWGVREEAANSGRAGITTSTLPNGFYPGHAQSLVVSPEIDLRTNFFMDQSNTVGAEAGIPRPQDPPLTDTHSTGSAVYQTMYYGCDMAAYTTFLAVFLAFALATPAWYYDSVWCQNYRALIDHEHSYASLEYSYRHNLAGHPTDPDQVQVMVFTRPPADVQDALTCNPATRPPDGSGLFAQGGDPFPAREGPFGDGYTNITLRPVDQPCQIVRPKTMDSVQATGMGFSLSASTDIRMGDGQNHTGFSDWTRASIDLSQWEGRSVWVGFLFTSGTIVNPEAYFSGDRFNTDADFRGFQLDDLEAKIPAAAVNLGVKPLSEPSFTLPGSNQVTLAPGEPVQVKANVTNLASEGRDVTVVTRILQGDTARTQEHWRPIGDDYEASFSTWLDPVGTLEVDVEFPPLGLGTYVAHVCVYRNETDAVERTNGDLEFCNDRDQVPRRGDCSEDPLEADPCNQFQFLRFRVEPAIAVTAGELLRSSTWVEAGGSLGLRMPLTNHGNVPIELPVTAQLLDLATGDCVGGACSQQLLALEPGGTQDIVLEPFETKQLEWTVQGFRMGHYTLFVQVGDAAGFSFEHDLRPSLLRPWESRILDVEGDLPVAENWSGFPQHGLRQLAVGDDHFNSDLENVQIGNDDEFLYIRLRTPADNHAGLAILFDDKGDNALVGGQFAGVQIRHDDGGEEDITVHAVRHENDPDGSWSWGTDEDLGDIQVRRIIDAVGGADPSPGLGQLMEELGVEDDPRETIIDAFPISSGVLYEMLVSLLSDPDDSDPGVAFYLYDLRIPIATDAVEAGLMANGSRHEHVGMMVRFCSDLGSVCDHFPDSAPLYDGDGLHAADGSLENELRQWHVIRLADPESTGFTHRALSPPFGVETNPPPYLIETFDGGTACPSLQGWLQPGADPTDRWNCGEYPDDGRMLMYKGHRDDFYANASGTASLFTRPIDIPGEASRPTVVLAHQYSTEGLIDDRNDGQQRVNTLDKLNLTLERWDPLRHQWVEVGLLEPEGGYTTEEQTGIADPRFTRTHPGRPDDGDLSGVSWWWPQGHQPDYRPLDRRLATGGEIYGGSPWTVDRVPLHGTHFGESVSIAGSTIRLRFDFQTDFRVQIPDRDHDWGWRIGGLAVVDVNEDNEPRFTRDLTIESLSLDLAFDPYELGLGPGSKVPVEVAVRNDGSRDANLGAGNRVMLFVDVVGTETSIACGEVSLSDTTIEPDQVLVRTGHCDLDGIAEGSRVALRAKLVHLVSGFTGNHQQRVPGTFLIQGSPVIGLGVNVSPMVDTPDTQRTLTVAVENHGNAALGGVKVTRTIHRVTDQGTEPGPPIQWNLTRLVPVGQAEVLSRTNTEPGTVHVDRWTPGRAGTYLLEFIVEAPGAARPVQDRHVVVVEALTELYREDFSGPARSVPGVVQGDMVIGGEPEGVWRLVESTRGDGSFMMRAGDPASGDIPANTSATIQLPAFDLTALKRATLTFDHRYDLEEMYDAGRVEMSLDGGKSWQALVPVPQDPDLPDGYPSQRLIGFNAILEQSGEVELFAEAFTGRSETLRNVSDELGWITSEIDLTRQPAFWAEEDIEVFTLRDFARFPDFRQPLTPDVVDSIDLAPRTDHRFTHSSWFLDEADSLGQERYWWIQNATFSEPRPLTGGKMWWSGTAGEWGLGETGVGSIRPLLDGTIDLSEWVGAGDLVLSFWDWRAGWQDTDGPGWGANERRGTGGNFQFRIDGQAVTPDVVERRADGWTKREVDVTAIVANGAGSIDVAFDYHSGGGNNCNSAAANSGLAFLFHAGTPRGCVWYAEMQNNRGWFIDSFEISIQTQAEKSTIYKEGFGDLSHDSTWGSIGGNPWSLVEVGESARDGGWHLEEVEVPGHGMQNVWRFSDPNGGGQGYPNNADSRLVTPVIDLTTYSGDRVALSFDHTYEFHGDPHRCRGNAANPPGHRLPDWNLDEPCPGPDLSIGRAIDGGQVQYQIYDELTGSWGPWQVMHGAQDDPELGVVRARGDQDDPYSIAINSDPDDWPPPEYGGWIGWRVQDGAGEQHSYFHYLRIHPGMFIDHIQEMGYPSMMHFPVGDEPIYSWQSGLGATFATTETWSRSRDGSYQPHDLAPVFSNEGDWDRIDWDASHLIGKKIRFGFHVWTNPSGEPCSSYPSSSEAGHNPARHFYRIGFGTGEGGANYMNQCDRPLDGWTVTNLGLQGQRFQGQEALIRFHVATDESFTKGDWSIGGIRLSGELYDQSVVFESDERHVMDLPGSTVQLEGAVRNLGAETRRDLAVAVEARRADTGQPVDVTLTTAGLVPIEDPGFLPDWVSSAYGPFSLVPATTDLDRSLHPVQVEVNLPEGVDTQVLVELHLLENVGPCRMVDNNTVCEWEYEPVVNERGSPLAHTTWIAEGRQLAAFELAPPMENRPDRLIADPAVVPPGNQTVFRTMILNNGTTMDPIEAEWTIQEIIRKGCPQAGSGCKQPGTTEDIETIIAETTTLTSPPARGETAPLEFTYMPSEEGLYRVVLKVKTGGTLLDEATTEFLVGAVEPYYLVDFAKTNATDAGWHPATPERGTSPPALNFRQVGERYIWGVTQEQYDQGIDYCHESVAGQGCRPQTNTYSNQNQARENPAYGLEAITESPLIDLGRVIGNSATLTLRQGHLFETRDGAVVEAILYESPVDPNRAPRPAFRCVNDDGDRRAAWFRIYPESPEAYQGLTRGYSEFQLQTGTIPSQSGPMAVIGWAPPRYNSLDLQPPQGSSVIGGPATDSNTIRFQLDGASPEWVCPPGFEPPRDDGGRVIDSPESLVNYTVQFRIRAGTTPLSIQNTNCNNSNMGTVGGIDNRGRCEDASRTTGGIGWQIDGLGVSSLDVSVSPQARVLPLFDGYPKRFAFHLENSGLLEETFRLELGSDPEDPINDWVTLPQTMIRLAPGEHRIIPFQVDIPVEPPQQPGFHSAPIRVSSVTDPGIYDEILITLDLLEQALPDLELRLSIPGREEPVPGFVEGSTAEFVATVSNLGRADSEAVPLRVEAVRDQDGQEIRIPLETGSLTVPALCPLSREDCEQAGEGRSSIPFGFNVPDVPGAYRIEVTVDPHGRLVQESLSNSRAARLVDVIPRQQPDLSVSDIHLGGVRADGYALEGTTVRIVVNVTNQGVVAATAAEINVRAGTALIVDRRPLPPLQPGQTHQVFANLSGLSAGETTIRANVIPATVVPSDLDPSNMEMMRVLRIRGLDIELRPPEQVVALNPGEMTTTRVLVSNEGNAVERIHLALAEGQGGWGFAATPNPVTVAPNATAWAVVTLQAHENATAGAYDLVVVGVPESLPTALHEVGVPVAVTERLDPPGVEVESLVSKPGPAVFNVSLTSRSNTPQNFSVGLDPEDWSGPLMEVTLPPNRDTHMELPFQIPVHTPPGDHTVIVRLLNETGAQIAGAPVTVNVTEHAAGSARWSDRILAPQADMVTRVFEVPLNVSNDGNVPFVPVVQVSGLSEGVEFLPVQDHPVVEPGGWEYVPVRLQVNAEFTKRIQGQVEVHMGSDLNQSAGNATVMGAGFARLPLPDLAALPDLAIMDVAIRPRSGIVPNEPVRIALTVSNAGFAEAPATRLYAFVDGNLLQTVPVGPLAPGETHELNLTWAFPRSGDWLVQLLADGPGDVTELHEDNNGWTRLVTVDSGGFTQRVQEAPTPSVLFGLLVLLGVAVLVFRRDRCGGGST